MRGMHVQGLMAAKMGHMSCVLGKNLPEELSWGWGGACQVERGKRAFRDRKWHLETLEGKDHITCPLKKLRVLQWASSEGGWSSGQIWGCPGRSRPDPERGLDSILKAMGTQMVFVNELNSMGNSKNNRPGDKRTRFKIALSLTWYVSLSLCALDSLFLRKRSFSTSGVLKL